MDRLPWTSGLWRISASRKSEGRRHAPCIGRKSSLRHREGGQDRLQGADSDRQEVQTGGKAIQPGKDQRSGSCLARGFLQEKDIRPKKAEPKEKFRRRFWHRRTDRAHWREGRERRSGGRSPFLRDFRDHLSRRLLERGGEVSIRRCCR